MKKTDLSDQLNSKDNADQMYHHVGDLTEESLLRKLEHNGLRMTVQRRHIIDILTKTQCTSPKEVWYEAREFVPDMGIATVYRLINRLEQIGVLSKTRNLAMGKVKPVLGSLEDKFGRPIEVKGKATLNLEELVRLGLVSRGIIGNNNQIELNIVGEKVHITVVS